MPASGNAQRLRWAMGLTGVAVVVLVAYTGYQALQAKDSLEVVASEFQEIAADLRTGDGNGARASLDKAQAAASKARNNTRGPGWWLTSRLPGVGDDVQAVRTVADVTDVLATDVLPDVVVASERLDPANLRPKNGRVAIHPLTEVAPAVVAADKEMQRQEGRVAALELENLNRRLAGPVELLQQQLSEAASLSSKASHAVRLLPSMLGQDGPRRYLVLFQNNAEIRATGGIPGALAVLRADRGKLSIVRQGTAGDLGFHLRPPLKLTGEEVALYERKLGMFGADVNFTPEFPRTAQIVRAMWRAKQGEDVDGVLSTDPVALSYLLEGTGPIRIAGGQTLTSSNAVDMLLSGVYRRQPDPDLQNAVFATAARSVFDAVAAGKGDPATAFEGLTRASDEGRLLAWSADKEEQRLLSETRLAGDIPRQSGPSPYLGVFLNDGTGAKMQYYLEHRVDVKPVSCNAGGRQTLEVTVTMKSTAPANAAELPVSVIGPRVGGQAFFGVRPGYQRINVYVYAPVEGWIEASAVDGEETPMSELEHAGHEVGARTVELAPGQTRRLTYTVVSGLDQPEGVDLRATPGVHSSGVGKIGVPVCGNS